MLYTRLRFTPSPTSIRSRGLTAMRKNNNSKSNRIESNRIESNGRQEAEEKEARGEAVAAPGALRMGLWRGLIWGRTSLGNAARLVYNSLAVPVAGATPLDYRKTKLPLNTEKLIETLFRCGLGGATGARGRGGGFARFACVPCVVRYFRRVCMLLRTMFDTYIAPCDVVLGLCSCLILRGRAVLSCVCLCLLVSCLFSVFPIERVHGHQIFVDGAFNGDPHPGNILLTPDGKLGLIDYGQVGTQYTYACSESKK